MSALGWQKIGLRAIDEAALAFEAALFPAAATAAAEDKNPARMAIAEAAEAAAAAAEAAADAALDEPWPPARQSSQALSGADAYTALRLTHGFNSKPW